MRDKISDFFRSTRKEQFELLERLVLQSSYSLDKDGVDLVGLIIQHALADCDLSVEVDLQEITGNNLIFSSAACARSAKGLSPIILVGHMDTVFHRESGFDYYKEDNSRVYGPGVIDMKGGLVTAVFLLKALQSQELLQEIPVIFICNSDEEIGSPGSTPIVQKYAENSLCGLVFECGGLNGEVVTGRKGKTGYILTSYGKSGHAAFTGRNGKASAIVELAHKIIQLEQLNDPSRGIVLNVGKIEGGTGSNVVPSLASAEIDTRYITDADGIMLRSSIEAVAARIETIGTRSEVTLSNNRFPMEQSEGNIRLFELYRQQADLLNITITDELRSGVSDANTLAKCKIPVLDGLGPIGDCDHSENEYMEKDSLPERGILATHLIMKIWEDQKERSYRNNAFSLQQASLT